MSISAAFQRALLTSAICLALAAFIGLRTVNTRGAAETPAGRAAGTSG